MMKHQTKPYNGVYAVMEGLKQSGFAMGIATYKREDFAIKLMEHFGFDKYWKVICGADGNNKLTKPDIIENCLMQLGVTATASRFFSLSDCVRRSTSLFPASFAQ
jgi:phosphoglycolate phosphatase-like HAD superfamily hydrolase